MRSHWQYMLLAVTCAPLIACTLASDEFHPVEVDLIPAEMPAVLPVLPAACTSDCAEPSGDETPVTSPTEPGSEATPEDLPLQDPPPPASTPSSAAPDPEPPEDEEPEPPEEPPAETPPAMTPPAMTPPPVTPPPVTPPPVTQPPPVVPPPVVPPPVQPIPEPEPPNRDLNLIGWAGVDGLGTPTTTGGAAGATVLATTPEQLEDFATRVEPLTILIAGTIRLARVDVASDKTLRGVGVAPRVEGGLRIRGRADALVRNVIVQNLTIDASFSDVEGDGVQIHLAHHVWVDHVDVRDAPDGNLDIVHGSDFVTVSFSRFSFSAQSTGSRLSTQIGHSDAAAAEDTGHLRVTLHHDFWDTGILGAMPSARFGDVHVFNSYYTGTEADAAITAAIGSRLLVESNFFEGVRVPYRLLADDEAEPQLRAVGNLVTAPNPTLQEAGAAFAPPYPYVLEAAAGLPARVRASAGATLDFDVPLL